MPTLKSTGTQHKGTSDGHRRSAIKSDAMRENEEGIGLSDALLRIVELTMKDTTKTQSIDLKK
jgi:hypothetical protein